MKKSARNPRTPNTNETFGLYSCEQQAGTLSYNIDLLMLLYSSCPTLSYSCFFVSYAVTKGLRI